MTSVARALFHRFEQRAINASRSAFINCYLHSSHCYRQHTVRAMSSQANGLMTPQHITKSILASEDAKWVRLHKIEWKDQIGAKRVWESAERTTRNGDCDAVAILAIINTPDQPPQVVLTTQYRPPIDRLCIELPAGLIDENETAEQAAVRELKEETGYAGKVISSTPIVWNDPGMTNANMRLVTIEVDTTEEGNAHPLATPETGEFIELKLVPLNELWTKLQEFEKDGLGVDARLVHMALGMNVLAAMYKT